MRARIRRPARCTTHQSRSSTLAEPTPSTQTGAGALCAGGHRAGSLLTWRVLTGRGGIGPGGFSFDLQSRPVLRSLRRLRPPAPSCLLARAEGGTEVKRSEGRCAVPISHCGPLPDGQTRAVPSGKKQAVTKRDKKDSIRGRMADTGEPFNVARRKTEAATGFFRRSVGPRAGAPAEASPVGAAGGGTSRHCPDRHCPARAD